MGLQVFEGVESVEGEDFALRTLFFPDGSTVTLKEFALFDDFVTPGNSGNTPACCGNQSYGNPVEIPLEEEIVGGTGMFEGITGTISGTLSIAGGVAIIRLSGTVTFGC